MNVNIKVMSSISNILSCFYRKRFLFITIAIITFLGNIDLWCNTSLLTVLKWALIAFFPCFLFFFFIISRFYLLRYIGYFLCIIQIVLSIINFFSYETWGFGFNERIFIILIETNSREISEFFISFPQLLFNFIILPTHLILWILLLILFIIIKYISFNVYRIFLSAISLLSIIITIVHISTSDIGKRDVCMIIKSALWLNHSTEMRKMLVEDMNNYINNNPIEQQHISLKDSINNIVLVIGESSARHHWQLYGYPLNTTPKLNSIRDSIFIFNDVLPPYSTTAESLQCILTTKTTISKKPWYYYVDIVSLSKKAGYKVSWYSNQEKVSQFGSSTGTIANNADIVHYEDSVNNQTIIGKRAYDAVLLKKLGKALNNNCSKPQLIILHTMGSHAEYSNRYPIEYKKFTKDNINNIRLSDNEKDIVAHYDNTIYYTDRILYDVIDSLSKSPAKNIMIYFSDHSEDVYDTGNVYLHAYKGKNIVKVPMIIWFSNSYISSHSQIVSNMNRCKDMAISTENIIHTIMNFMGISCEAYNSQLDFLSEDYNCQTRYFEGKPFNE